MLVPNRHGSSNSYRYGFNGKEKDDEIKGQGNHYDYGMRNSDPRTGRFFSVDPLTKTFPFYSPYHFAGNTPIAAIDLDGEEPKIVVTNKVTGHTKMHVYGMQNVETILVRTYKAIIQYTDKKGNVTEVGTFNVTRDGWFDMGTDVKGNVILYNRSSDPIDNRKVNVVKFREQQYGLDAPSIVVSGINSPIPKEFNETTFEKGLPDEELPETIARDGSGIVYGSQFHVGGIYIDESGTETLAGAYGCNSIVDPSQVSPSPGEKPIPSNAEMKRFGKAVKTAQEMQVKEHKKEKKTEVEYQSRQNNKIKHVKSKKP